MAVAFIVGSTFGAIEKRGFPVMVSLISEEGHPPGFSLMISFSMIPALTTDRSFSRNL